MPGHFHIIPMYKNFPIPPCLKSLLFHANCLLKLQESFLSTEKALEQVAGHLHAALGESALGPRGGVPPKCSATHLGCSASF